MRVLLFCSLLIAGVDNASANTDKPPTIDLTWRLHARNMLVIAKQQTRPFFRDRNVQYRLRQWLNAPANRTYVESCQEHLSPLIHSYNTLAALCWAKRQDNAEAIKWLLTHYYLDLAVSLLELTNDPRYEAHYQQLASEMLVYLRDYEGETKRLSACFNAKRHAAIAACLYRDFAAVNRPKHHLYVRLASKNTMLASEKIPYFALNTAQIFPFHFGHASSETGWVEGNSTHYAITTRTDANFGEAIDRSNAKLIANYPASGQGSLRSMYRRIKSQGYQSVFTDIEQGEQNSDGLMLTEQLWHPDSNGNTDVRDVYAEAARLIRAAEQTVFIDMFALGGVVGIGFAKLILAQLEAKPQLKVFILRDVVNHFGSLEEQVPVFNYLLAYSYLFPHRLIISEAHIYDHISGLPHYLAAIINDDLISNSGIQDTLNLAVQAVSDHSKLLVVDGKGKYPKALISSKNWGDQTGAIFFDDGILVEGAAAAVVQDDFYHDMRLGLQKVMAAKYPAGKIAGHASYIDTLYQGVKREDTDTLPLTEEGGVGED
ncbi:MAG: hypothetical protein OYH77_02930, partial [Pseudomonadota bacterium]|nr:hypothetical protein [Pseudomonadota bacterium]